MDLKDLISGGSEYIRKNRPEHPDMDRISEIVLNMKAASSEAQNMSEHEANWQKLIEDTIDYDSLAWQALNVMFDVYGIRTSADLTRLKYQPQTFQAFISSLQAFYDGFLLGTTFQQRGGHRDV